MSPIPDVNVSILDGALGLAADNGAASQVKVGTSSAGAYNTLVAVSDLSTLKSTFGVGPLVEAAAVVLAEAGGPVYCMRVNGSTAGAVGTVTASKTGTVTLAVTGAAFDAYNLVIQIIQGGATLAAGTATFKYSLDGGDSYSAEIAVPTSGVYAADGNLTFTWTYTSGTAFVAADQWSATCTGPSYTTSDLATTFTALFADPRTWFAVHVVGPVADLAGARTLFAALGSQMATAATSYRYALAVMEAPNGVTDAAMLANTTGLGDLADARVVVGAGNLETVSPISGRIYTRNVAWKALARASKVSPSQEIAAVEDGPLVGVSGLDRDEQATPGLDNGRFTTARSIIGRRGAYITRGRVFAAAGSDFSFLTNRRVIDLAAGITRDAALDFLNSKIPVNKDGTIREDSARAIEKVIERKVRDRLGADIVDVSVAIDRTTNVLSTGKLVVRERVTPFGYASSITVELGFTSPAVAAAAK